MATLLFRSIPNPITRINLQRLQAPTLPPIEGGIVDQSLIRLGAQRYIFIGAVSSMVWQPTNAMFLFPEGLLMRANTTSRAC